MSADAYSHVSVHNSLPLYCKQLARCPQSEIINAETDIPLPKLFWQQRMHYLMLYFPDLCGQTIPGICWPSQWHLVCMWKWLGVPVEYPAHRKYLQNVPWIAVIIFFLTTRVFLMINRQTFYILQKTFTDCIVNSRLNRNHATIKRLIQVSRHGRQKYTCSVLIFERK